MITLEHEMVWAEYHVPRWAERILDGVVDELKDMEATPITRDGTLMLIWDFDTSTTIRKALVWLLEESMCNDDQTE